MRGGYQQLVNRVRYFAYGSNMETATFRGRRGIEVVSAAPARAGGWRLVLDKPPLLPVGQAFANIVPDPDGAVLGVVYEIGVQDLAHLDLTEGVLVDNYRRLAISVTLLATPAPRSRRSRWSPTATIPRSGPRAATWRA